MNERTSRAPMTLRQARLFLAGIAEGSSAADLSLLSLTGKLLAHALESPITVAGDDRLGEQAAERLLERIRSLPPQLGEEFLGWLEQLSREGENLLQLQQREGDHVDVGLLREVEEETESGD